jgi:hypothetical protein
MDNIPGTSKWLGFQITLGWQEDEEASIVKKILQVSAIMVQFWSRPVFTSKMKVTVKRNTPVMDLILMMLFNRIMLLPAIPYRKVQNHSYMSFGLILHTFWGKRNNWKRIIILEKRNVCYTLIPKSKLHICHIYRKSVCLEWMVNIKSYPNEDM